MSDEQQRSIWNVVALIATLGLAAVVAVVAVSRSDRIRARAVPSPSISASPSPSPTSPGALAGEGPYLIYTVASGEVFAHDLGAKQWISMGHVDGEPVRQIARQPGDGGLVAFATQEGTVWRVDREGLNRVAILPVTDGRRLDGGAVSRDGRRYAIASTGTDPELLLVNLGNGRTSAFPRKSGSADRYPDEPLAPIGWSLGGSLVYQIPICDCDTGSAGLYIYDLEAERSSIVSATSQVTLFDQFGISPDGQELVFGAWDERPCENDPDSQCPDPPYTLRRLAAGRQSSTVLRRESDELFRRVLWSTSGEALLLIRVDQETRSVSFELADPESGDPLRSTIEGVPADASPLALLPRRVVVVEVGSQARSLQVVAGGSASVVAEADQEPVFLGWLR